MLVVADFHAPDVRPSEARLVTYRSYDFQRAPDPAGELRTALLAALDDAGFAAGRRRAIEAGTFPTPSPSGFGRAGRTPVACDAAVEVTPDLEAIKRACRLADVVQQAVKDHAEPGISEAELAGSRPPRCRAKRASGCRASSP